MTKRRTPTSFTAGRKVVLLGSTYQPGDAVPNAVVKSVKKLSALVSRRILVPNTDPWYRRTKARSGAPTDFPPASRAKIT